MTDLLRRVQKLLALATSDNVHEAASAARRAQALIDEHRLQELLSPGPILEEVGEEALERARRPRVWRAVLAAGIARENGCLAYQAALGRETELRVAGRQGDRSVVRWLFEGLAPRIEWLSATQGAGKDRAWHDAFRVGAAEAVVDRLRGADPGADEPALVRVDREARHDAVEAWAEQNLRLGKGRGLRVDPRGFRQGQAAGIELTLPKSSAPRRQGRA